MPNNIDFSDKIELAYKPQDAGTVKVDLLRTGIAWESDKKYKFKNPVIPEGQTLQQGKYPFLHFRV